MLWDAINGQRTWRKCYFSEKKQYGRAPINIDQESDLLSDVEDKSIMMSKYSIILPDGFNKIAHTENTLHAAIANDEKSYLAYNSILKLFIQSLG